jgi:hypothetical protein
MYSSKFTNLLDDLVVGQRDPLLVQLSIAPLVDLLSTLYFQWRIYQNKRQRKQMSHRNKICHFSKVIGSR